MGLGIFNRIASIHDITVYKCTPKGCTGKVNTIYIALEDEKNKYKIVSDFDQTMNTDSIVSEKDSKITLLKNMDGIVTR